MSRGARMYEIVPYQPDRKAEIAGLQAHLWRGDAALNAAYFEWKYEQNPYFPAPLVHLALSDGHLVGMRGMFGSRWEAGDPAGTFLVPAADDLVIAPEHRLRGLFGRIMHRALEDLAARGYAYAFSLSPGAATLTASLASGWRSAGHMRPLQRATPADATARRLRARIRRLPLPRGWLRRLRSLDPVARHRPFERLDGQVGRLEADGVSLAAQPRAAAMADLVRRLGHDGRLRHVRDETYLAWRFRNPLHEYRFLFADADALVAYLVLQAYRLDPGRGVNIVDWEGTSPEIRGRLLRAAVACGQFPNLNIWTASLTVDALAHLRDAGFAPSTLGPLARSVPSVLVRPIGADRPAAEPCLGGRRLLDPASWDMRMVYSMAG